MRDLEKAKRCLNANDLTLSIVKNGEILFETSSKGISGFLEAYEKLGDVLKGASVADKVVGKAIALLSIHAKVHGIYAEILSKSAKSVLEKYEVYHEWGGLVENILNIDETDICPFEKLAQEISNPKEACRKLKVLQNSLKQCKMKADE